MFLTLINLVGLVYMNIDEPVFVNITDEVFFDRAPIGSFISIRDYDNDGLEDLLFDNRLFKNVSYLKTYFYEVTVEAGLEDAVGHGTFIDFNNDSCLDIIFYGQNIDLQIYKNLCDGTFERIEKIVGLEGCKHTEAITYLFHKDFRYGLIYCANYEYKDEYFNDYLYASDGDFAFYDVSYLIKSERAKIATPSRCVVSGDLNNDNLVDFYVCSYRLFPNFMFVQNKDGNFINEAFNLNTSSFSSTDKIYNGSHTIGVNLADLNQDGVMDLIVSNLAHNDYERGRYNKKSEILLFDKDKYSYQDIRRESGIKLDEIGTVLNGIYKDELFSGGVSADFNNDGLIDIFFNQVYKNPFSFSRFFTGISNRPYFADSTFATGIIIYNSLGSGYLDLNRDGCLDLIASGENKDDSVRRIKIYENICKNVGDYIGFKLVGRGNSSSAIGSKVRIYLAQNGEKKILLRQVESTNSGFGQQNSEILHFGLGSNYDIDHIEIEWSSGTFQILYNYKINSINYVYEPESIFNCDIQPIEYSEECFYLKTDCESDYIFLGNSCASNIIEIKDRIINNNSLSRSNFCKNYILLLNKNGVGIKKFLFNL